MCNLRRHFADSRRPREKLPLHGIRLAFTPLDYPLTMSQAAAVAAKSVAETAPADAWAYVMDLPCQATVDLPLPGFTVGTLARLEQDMVIDSHWNVSEDVPLRANGELIAWSEFEVVGNKLAVRVTELA
jgi:flagellar motor switch/type III secretory pathway protein FliN